MSQTTTISRREFLGLAAIGALALSRKRKPIPYGVEIGPEDTLVVLTDVHIGLAPPRNVAWLSDRLHDWLHGGAYVVLGGDFLDLWCADDEHILDAGREVFKVLRKRPRKNRRKDRLWYVVGNHDFRVRDELAPPERVPDVYSVIWDQYTIRGRRSFRRKTAFLREMRIRPDRVYHRYLPVRAGELDVLITHGDETDFGYWARRWGVGDQIAWVYRMLDAMRLSAERITFEHARAAVTAALTTAFAHIESLRLGIPRWRAYDRLRGHPMGEDEERASPEAQMLSARRRGEVFASTLAHFFDEVEATSALPPPPTEPPLGKKERRRKKRADVKGSALPESAIPAPSIATDASAIEWLTRLGIISRLDLAVARLPDPESGSDLPWPRNAADLPAFPPKHLIMGHRHLPARWEDDRGAWAADAGTWLHARPEECNYVVVKNGHMALHGRRAR